MRSETISFGDLLQDSIEVDGLLLDATVDAIVRKVFDGKSESYHIEFFDVGDVYINVQGELVKLDQESFMTRNKTRYDRFVNACELLALTKAKNAQVHEFDEIEVGA